MQYFQDKEGRWFLIANEGEELPPDAKPPEFATAQEAAAFLKQLLHMPGGKEKVQQIMLAMQIAQIKGEPPKPH